MKFVLATITYLCLLGTTFAQWESMNGPYGGFINDLCQNDDYQFAATTNGLYRSQDEGNTWAHLPFNNEENVACLQVANDKKTVVTDVVDYEGQNVKRRLFISIDDGFNWTELFRPSSNTYFQISVFHNRIYLAEPNCLWVSLDKGASWKKSQANSDITHIINIDTRNGVTYINTGVTLFISTGSEDNFYMYPVPDSIGFLRLVRAFDDFILAESNSRIYRSENNGITWSFQYNGLNGYTDFSNVNNDYYSITCCSILLSEDNGHTWNEQNTTNFPVQAHTILGTKSKLFVGSSFDGLKVTTDKGKTLIGSYNGISACNVQSISAKNGLLLTGATYIGVMGFNAETMKWDTTPRLPKVENMYDILFKGEYAVALVGRKIFKTKSDGIEWTDVSNSLFNRPSRFFEYDNLVLCGGADEANTATGLTIGNLSEGGWQNYNNYIDGMRITSAYLFAQNENTLFLAKRKTIFRSLDNGMSWDTAMNGVIIDINNSFTNLYAFGDIIIALEYDLGPQTSVVHISFNNGDDWTTTNAGIPQRPRDAGIKNISSVEGVLIAAMINREDAVYASFDQGVSWRPFFDGLPQIGDINRITYDSTYIYAATRGQGVYRRKIADLQTTSSKPITKIEAIALYPNPTDDILNIVLPDQYAGIVQMTITDIGGKTLLSKNIWMDGRTDILTHHLPSGVYFLFIQSSEKQYSSKFVVQH